MSMVHSPSAHTHRDAERAVLDPRPAPGKSGADPMCINFYCPSSFVCRRFVQEPYQGAKATIFVDPSPDLLGGLLCSDFDPSELSPAAIRKTTSANSVGTKAEGRSAPTAPPVKTGEG